MPSGWCRPAVRTRPFGKIAPQRHSRSGRHLRTITHGGQGVDARGERHRRYTVTTSTNWRLQMAPILPPPEIGTPAQPVSRTAAGIVPESANPKHRIKHGIMTSTPPAQPSPPPGKTATRLVSGGRDPFAHHGFVNPPAHHASTALYPSPAPFSPPRPPHPD